MNMKTILLTIGGDNDYDAMVFDDNSAISAIELAKIMYLDENFDLMHKVEDEDGVIVDIPVKLQIFNGTVPKWFVNFVRGEVQDYDSSKHTQFYLFTLDDFYPGRGEVDDTVVAFGDHKQEKAK